MRGHHEFQSNQAIFLNQKGDHHRENIEVKDHLMRNDLQQSGIVENEMIGKENFRIRCRMKIESKDGKPIRQFLK